MSDQSHQLTSGEVVVDPGVGAEAVVVATFETEMSRVTTVLDRRVVCAILERQTVLKIVY